MATLITLITFDSADGAYPGGDLLIGSDGNLFGTAGFGGANGVGTVFEITASATGYASAPSTLISFDGDNGAVPSAGLIADATGDLFGTASNGGDGGGTVFEIVNTVTGYAATPTVLIGNGLNFTFSDLITDAAGDLFGTSQMGGDNFQGSVFEIANTSTGYSNSLITVTSFDGGNGANLLAGLLMDSAGDLFGTTQFGGASSNGTVFEVPFVDGGYASAPIDLFSFNGTDGSSPESALIADAAGDLFGTTDSGGEYGQGTVFEVPFVNGTYASIPTVLISFNGTDGVHPQTPLLLDAAGDLFGTTDTTAFEIPKIGAGYASTPTTLANFGSATGVLAGLTADAAGDLFGTTVGENASGDGTVFELTTTGFVVCFLAGTQIATPTGEREIEQLQVGDMVSTLRNAARRIVWIGEGRVLATRGHRTAATPVIVRKGALANNVPHSDLRVTMAHALYIDKVLIPVEFLVNHRSILWDDQAQEVTLYHIELETHDVLLANGAPAESYRDDGNRWLFQNADSGPHPRPQSACAPVLTGGPIVDAVWQQLLERAGPRPGLPLTSDPDLYLMVDNQRIDAASRHELTHVFILPRRPTRVRVVSRAGAPAELGLARDPRLLGVAIRRILVRQKTHFLAMSAEDPALVEGFHAFEADCGLRWTDGDAMVPAALLEPFNGPMELVLQLACTTRYPVLGRAAARAAA